MNSTGQYRLLFLLLFNLKLLLNAALYYLSVVTNILISKYDVHAVHFKASFSQIAKLIPDFG